jgi:pyruvate dehydrogenase E2 component (dihydrolipoamide acetyltransferase)
MSEILLPDLGEGVSGGIVAALSVAPGDSVSANDAIIEIETDKAVLPVPAPADGVIAKLLVAEGDKITVGQAIAAFEGGAAVAAPAAEPAAPAAVEPVPASSSPAPASASSKKATVQLPDLGEGVSGGIVTSIAAQAGDVLSEGDAIIELETDKAVLPVPAPAAGTLQKVTVSVGDKIDVGQVIAEMDAEVSGEASSPAPTPAAEPSAPVAKAPAPAPVATPVAAKTTAMPGASVPAGPATRKLARELGVDLSAVKGTRRGGRVSVEDVKTHVKAMNLGAKALAEAPAAAAPTKPDWPSLPDFEKFGPVRREKMSNLRGIISDRMSMCWNRIPHVFQFNEVDLTSLGEVQARYKDDFKAKGSSVSPTNFIIKAMAICLKEFPQFNASLDEESGEIIYKDYVNIGVAVDTPTGLIVPVLKNVDQLSIFQIGKDLKDLAKKTRDRKVTQEDLSGGGMTLSNLGGIGGTHFTPIVNWPEVAILGVGRGEVKPKYINGEVVPRNCTQMTLSYDHRVIDGADGARFMVRLTEILENIERTLLGG